ncbi:hypothetical protein M413DRAFT_449377 [Hebeloma cylindrosporum]|uniref:Thioesterase domain-containing protein n=1 Tax=Hebeloma cylindrosporum TaxID=76867 RepID=A0A0C3BX53_HEBCY|nr:hypothetical protein M413DRAFT_449377 [Hebeloma cylindrosporum h7]
MATGRRYELLRSPLPTGLVAGISGNAPNEIKELPVRWLMIFRKDGKGFAGAIAGRVKVTEVSVVPHPADPLKLEGKVVSEIDVTEDMCNSSGVVDDGCIAFLIDESSTTAMVVINAYSDINAVAGVSQTINFCFHHPAVVGTKLRIVSTSLASGYESNSGRCEVIDMSNHRLVASGTQMTMPPSMPKSWQ